jgi:hypothetical protein
VNTTAEEALQRDVRACIRKRGFEDIMSSVRAALPLYSSGLEAPAKRRNWLNASLSYKEKSRVSVIRKRTKRSRGARNQSKHIARKSGGAR